MIDITLTTEFVLLRAVRGDNCRRGD